ncbi:MAG: S9 family peptidase [Cyclobacteriaceae bacterium]
MTDSNRSREPIAEIKPKQLLNHGHVRVDNYYWMNDRENPEVIAYLEEENQYLKEKLESTEPLQEKLFEEMKGRIKKDDASVPYFKNGYFYYSKFENQKEYPIYCRKKGKLSSEETVVLDVNRLAEGQDYMQVNALGISEDNEVLGYSEDNQGRRIYNIKFKNLITEKPLSDQLTAVTGNFVWANDNQTLYYTQQDPNTLRPFKVYQHVIGTNQEEDRLVYEEKDETFIVQVKKSKSKSFLFIESQSTVSTEYRMLQADQPKEEWMLIQPRMKDLEYEVEHYEDKFIIRTNHKKATNFKLVQTPIAKPSLDNWEDLIPHRDNVLIEEFEIFKHHMVICDRFNGLNRLEIRSWDGEKNHVIRMDDPAYNVWIGNNPEFYTEILRFGYTSLTTPSTIYDYHMDLKEKSLMKQQEVVGGHEISQYHSERIWVKGSDDTEIPISMVYKKELFNHDGTNPLLLYAYGSYGFSTDPYFSSHRLSLLDRGFVFALAHVRGGQEMGRNWYEDGKMLKKKNTFTDFIDCGKYLIEKMYCHKEKLFAMGGSAGGLLVGAVVNISPALFKGVIASVPFVDVVTTMLDESIPLTTGEFDEWGNPKEKEYYEYMLSYSPYDNVIAQNYPHLLVTSGLHDSQVQYWEPTKWVAKLRAFRTNDNLLLLHTNMEAGHGGASGRFKALRELALQYAFLIFLLEDDLKSK